MAASSKSRRRRSAGGLGGPGPAVARGGPDARACDQRHVEWAGKILTDPIWNPNPEPRTPNRTLNL